MKIKKILLVGGSGIIGRELIEKLKNNYKVFIIDKKILKFTNQNIKFKKIDIEKNKNFYQIKEKFDVIIYLIGAKGGQDSLNLSSLDKYIKCNFEIMKNFFDNLNLKKTYKIIFASTEHVYGDKDLSNKRCMSKEPSPKNFYGFSKLLSEKYLFNYYKEKSVNIDILRFPRVITEKENNIILDFINKVSQEMKIYLKKNTTKFNFIYIGDLIDSISLCIKQEDSNFRILNVFNNSKAENLKDILKKIVKKLKKEANVIYLEKDKFDHNPNLFSISNKFTQNSLKWKPKMSLNKIILKLVNFYETKKKI
jgi:nucleoside-diphosphate-sugar epimerase